jgi:hypothetical protein
MLTMAALAVALTGCGKTDGGSKPEAVAPPQQSAQATAEAAATGEAHATAAAPEAAAGVECGHAEEKKEEGCSGDHGTEPVANPDERAAKDPATGAELTAVGAALAGVETVAVKDLLANPDSWAGKSIRLEGNVSAMCTHRRGWFAVVDDGDRSGSVLRVLTAPAFLVPEGSVGRKVRTEGKVEVVEVPAGAARHYAKDHKVGDQAAIEGDAPIKQIVVRADGAEFL